MVFCPLTKPDDILRQQENHTARTYKYEKANYLHYIQLFDKANNWKLLMKLRVPYQSEVLKVKDAEVFAIKVDH